MVWMETYLVYCSVRLGVIVAAILVFMQIFIPTVLFITFGMEAINPFLQLFANDYEYGKHFIIRTTINWIENNVQAFIALICTIHTIHMLYSGLAVVGALKLKKWCLLPFIIIEFGRVVFCFVTHILLMIILKKKLNLGLLIAVTLAGGFFILFLGYNWAASVALYQIIELIYSDRYRKLYGDDPYNPQLPPSYDSTFTPPPQYGMVENVRVLITPRSGDIDEQKQQQTQGIAKLKTFNKARQPVIAVLPVNYKHTNNSQQQQQNDFSIDNGNWQWSELMVGRQAKQPIISRDWSE